MLRHVLIRVAVAFTAAAAALVVLEAPAAAATRGPFYYAGQDSYKCIDDPAGDMRNNIRMTIYTCNDGAYNEQWYEIDAGGGYMEIRNRKSGKCLTVQNASTALNAAIIQYTCSGAVNAQWRPELINENNIFDYYVLRNKKSGKCLTVVNAASANGTGLIQHNCEAPEGNDLWTWFAPSDLPTWRLYPRS